MKKLFVWILAVIVIVCGASSCKSCTANQDKVADKTAAYIPKAPDYNDSKM